MDQHLNQQLDQYYDRLDKQEGYKKRPRYYNDWRNLWEDDDGDLLQYQSEEVI